MAIKIGKYYITQNNPRELLREKAELINVLNEIKEQLKLERKLALSLERTYTLSVIDKLLDKVRKWN